MGTIGLPRNEPRTIPELWKYLKQIILQLNNLDFSNLVLGGIKVDNLAELPGFSDKLPEGEIPSFKLNFRQIIVENDTWTDNSPVAGSVTWSACKVTFAGQVYDVVAGNTANKWIYWQKANPGLFQTSATFPFLGDEDSIVAINVSGAHHLIWKDPLAVQVVENALIKDATIESAKIVSLVAEKILVGTLIGHILKTAASGKRVEVNASANEVTVYGDAGELRMRIGGSLIAFYNSGGTQRGFIQDGDTQDGIRVALGSAPVQNLYFMKGNTLMQFGTGALSDIRLRTDTQSSATRQIPVCQWGYRYVGSVPAGSDSAVTITFPTGFQVIPRGFATIGIGFGEVTAYSETTTNMVVNIRNPYGGAQNFDFKWLAVGG